MDHPAAIKLWWVVGKGGGTTFRGLWRAESGGSGAVGEVALFELAFLIYEKSVAEKICLWQHRWLPQEKPVVVAAGNLSLPQQVGRTEME